MNEFLLFLISSFGVFRLSELLCCDKGPAGIFEKARNWFTEGSFFDDLISCPYCNSFWISAAWSIYLAVSGYITLSELPLWLAGVWGGAIAVLRSIRERK